MRRVLLLNRIDTGFVLQNGIEKYLLTYPRKAVDGVMYCLKQVLPFEEYITGLFHIDKKNFFQGKTKDGKKVILKLYLDYAELSIK